MTLKEGDLIKNRLTGQTFVVEKIKRTLILLRSEDGRTRVWLDPGVLDAIYEMVVSDGQGTKTGPDV